MPANLEDITITGKSKKRVIIDRSEALATYFALCLKIGHEIANPLTGIIGLTELLLAESKTLNKSQTESLRQISFCAEQIDNALRQLTDSKSIIIENKHLLDEIQAILEMGDKITVDD